jgi:nicotinamide-nucleotide amidase
MLVTAESCTGGWVAQAVTGIAGSSAWFERGFVTYSNAAKQELLGVSQKTLKKHGAVSEQTAREMAAGALKRSRGTVALAVTGIAGPGGGSDKKPVGTVIFARARRDADPKEIVADTRHFGDRGRGGVRLQAALCALELLMPVSASPSRDGEGDHA